MKLKLLFILMGLISFHAHGMSLLKGLFKKKPKSVVVEEIADLNPEVAQKKFWDALKDGAPQDACEQIDKAAEKLAKAMPGVTIEIIFNTQVNNNDQTNTTYVGAFDPSNIKKCKNMLVKGQEQIHGGFKSLSEYFLNNKRKIFNIICAGTLITVQLALISIKQKLRSTTCWSKWDNDEVSEQLSESLFNEIQINYCNVSHPADFITPLMCFIEDVENEKYYVQKYQQIISLLEHLWINRLFLYDAKLYSSAKGRIEKLDRLKKSFTRWVSNFKIQQVQNNTQNKVLGIDNGQSNSFVSCTHCQQ